MLVRVVGGPFAPMASLPDLFFMGAAFLLLETKSVVQFALLFGTTWFVNALVFAGVLLRSCCAVEVARRTPLPRPPRRCIALLLGRSPSAWVVPPSALLALDGVPRFVAAVVICVHADLPRQSGLRPALPGRRDSTVAFGANLLGAMVGGVLEYAALVTGYQALLILVALLYGGAFLVGPMRLRRTTAVTAATSPAS